VKATVREIRAVVFTLLNLFIIAYMLKERIHTEGVSPVRNLTGIGLFVLSFLWFYFPGEYVLIANQDLTLFLKTRDYLFTFLDRPGGLLDYFGSFLSQFFRFRLTGALLLAGMVTSVYYLSGTLDTRISGKRELFILGVIAPVLFLGMHNFYPHQLSHSLGFILALGLAAACPLKRRGRRLFLFITVPLVYLVGGGYVWVFCGIVLAGEIVNEGRIDIISALLTILYPATLIILGAWLIYLDPLKELAVMHLPFGKEYGQSHWPWLFVGWTLLLIILAGIPKPWHNKYPLWKLLSEITVSLVAILLVLNFSYNRKNAEFFHIEKLAVGEDWDGLLRYTAKHPSRNLFGSYYTNLALAKKGRLCTDLFRYPQSFGRRGLCFEWEAKGEILRRGSDFFWTIHFVNEAQHWAFESMIIDGFTRRNLKRLIQTELIRGNFKVAEKYIELLGNAMFQQKLANHYAGFLYDVAAIEDDPELGPAMRSHMQNDFFSEGMDLEKNLRLLLANSPGNRPAFDYLMALLMLEKEVDQIAMLLPGYLETFNGLMPELLDETLLVYKITHQQDNLSNIMVSRTTMQRFEEYTRILRQYRDPQEAARMLYPSYRDSFWFYLNFSSLKKG
jgi:hypothetical protein